MFRLAVGALVQTASVDRNDLNQRVLSDLWQQEGSAAELLARFFLLAIQPNCVTWQDRAIRRCKMAFGIGTIKTLIFGEREKKGDWVKQSARCAVVQGSGNW